jgi:hypothetical protein
VVTAFSEQYAQGGAERADKAAMERRKQSRVDIDQTVTVTVLGAPDSPSFQAATVDMSSSGMRILSPVAVPYQAVVKVQAGELLLLGEVIRVENCERGHMLALKLQHSLEMWGDLYRLNDALHAESPKIARASVEKEG